MVPWDSALAPDVRLAMSVSETQSDILDYFYAMYVGPLRQELASTGRTLDGLQVLDCACGHGWVTALCAAYGANVTAVDLSPEMVDHTRALCSAMNLSGSVRVMPGDVSALPFADRAFGAVFSIETIEHVPIDQAMGELVRVCDEFFVIETINRTFPIDTHDTPLPLVHWFPHRLRQRFNLAYGHTEVCRYPSLRQVERHLRRFDLVTPFKTFSSPDAWRAVFPLRHPYKNLERITLRRPKWRAKAAYYNASFRILGSRSRYVLDKVQGIYRRRRD